MIVAKYFWDLTEQALEETERILKNPGHPRFCQRLVALMSRCDKPKELFSVISREMFVEVWPKVRKYWMGRARHSESRDWWETIYEQILRQEQNQEKKPKGSSAAFPGKFGRMIKEARLEKGLSQKQVALAVGMKQPDISRIEEGEKNITLSSMLRLCRVLGIRKIDVS